MGRLVIQIVLDTFEEDLGVAQHNMLVDGLADLVDNHVPQRHRRQVMIVEPA